MGKGENHEILQKCPVLNEYSQFVDVVRRHQKTGEENAFQNAVTECIEQGIFADYLRKKGSEAVNMLIAEYDYDMDIQVQREEAREDGIAEGLKLGREQGKREGNVITILELLGEIEMVPEDLKERIRQEEDMNVLKKWLKLAAKADSLEAFQREM